MGFQDKLKPLDTSQPTPTTGGDWQSKLTPLGQPDAQSLQSPPPTPTTPDSIWSTLASNAGNIAKGVLGAVGNAAGMPSGAFPYAVDAVTNAPQAIKDNFNQGMSEIQQGGETVPENILHKASGVATIASTPFAPFFQPVGKSIQQLSDMATDNPSVQKAALALPNLPYNRIGQDVGDIGNIAGTVAGALGTMKGGETLATPPKPEDVAATAKANSNIAIADLQKEWQRPANVNTPSFNNARAVLEKAPDTPQFLAQQGVNPKALIEDGRYNTEEAANALKDTAAKLSRDTLRPSLQFADYQVQPTPVDDINASAIKALKRDPNITAGDMKAITAKIDSELSALKEKYPHGMTLTDMHDERITYQKNGGYHPLKSAADNNTATANRAIGSALAEVGDAKTPESVPVKDFRSYLQKYYKAADYLDALNTKKAPVTLGQSIARGVAKYTGAALGGHFGGGVVSEFAGYQIGKAVEHALENLSGSARDAFIHNIQVTNPEAFTKVQEFLQNMTSGNTGVPRLNAPSSIIPPAPSVENQMQSRANSLKK